MHERQQASCDVISSHLHCNQQKHNTLLNENESSLTPADVLCMLSEDQWGFSEGSHILTPDLKVISSHY